MNIRDINKPVTSKTLNETMAKKFGTTINVESFTLEQLQDARNKIRSKVFDIETNESFGGLPENKTYSKNKLFLDVLNAAISERGDIQDEPIKEAQSAAQKAAFQKMLDKKKGTKPADTDDADKKPEDDKKPGDDKKVDEGKPDFLDLDKDGDKKEPMKKAAKDAKKKKTDEGKDIIGNYFTTLLEGAEDKAEIVMASKDMVDKLTGWMEDTAEMQTESMLELADAIRDEMGAQQADAFTNQVKPSLESLYTAMEATRIALTGGVGMLTGEGEAPAMDMGADVPGDDMDMDMEADMDMEPTADMDDEFSASATAAGGEDEAGRAKRESKLSKKKMLETSRRLGAILSSSNT